MKCGCWADVAEGALESRYSSEWQELMMVPLNAEGGRARGQRGVGVDEGTTATTP